MIIFRNQTITFGTDPSHHALQMYGAICARAKTDHLADLRGNGQRIEEAAASGPCARANKSHIPNPTTTVSARNKNWRAESRRREQNGTKPQFILTPR
jgi:hypothetical protein